MCERCNLPTVPLRAPNHASLHSAPNRNAPQETAPLAVSKIRQNPTESYKILRKFVCARARTRAWCFSPRHSHEGGNPHAAAGNKWSSPVIPTKAGILMPPPLATFPSLSMDCAQTAVDSTHRGAAVPEPSCQ